jgi:hypothetical protein
VDEDHGPDLTQLVSQPIVLDLSRAWPAEVAAQPEVIAIDPLAEQ